MMRHLACLTLALAAAVAAGQTTAPATTRSATTTATTGPASPKAALKQLALAMQAGDAPAIRALLWTQNDPERQMVDAVVDLAEATAGLRKAAVAGFGPEGARPLVGTPPTTQGLTAPIDAAQEEIIGDIATVYMGGQQEISLARIEGSWRVPISAVATQVIPENMDEQTRDIRHRAKAYRDTAAEIAEKRFKDADAARQALESRILRTPATTQATQPAATTRAATTRAAATAPTTRPATRPTTAP